MVFCKGDELVNTKYKSGKIIWIVLAIVFIAFLTVSAWLALPIFKDNYDAMSDTAVSKTSVVKLFKEKPYIVASSAEKAAAYAEKLGIPFNQYNYVDSKIVLRVEDGVWKGMANSDVLGKYTHLLLPNDIT